MNAKQTVLLITVLGIVGKSGILVVQGRLLESLGWFAAGGWIIWIIYAYQNNKDLPAAGPFRYADGGNQIARMLYVISMMSIYFVAAILQK